MRRSRAYLQFKLGDARILWINPQKIKFHVGTNEPASEKLKSRINTLQKRLPALGPPARILQASLGQCESWVISAHNYPRLSSIEDDWRRQLIAYFLAYRDRSWKSAWHSRLSHDLKKRGIARHKKIKMHSIQDIDVFFREYILEIKKTLETSGWDTTKADDFGTALISDDGAIHKAHSGNHRFFMAQLLGLTRFPLKILGAHEAWTIRNAGRQLDTEKLRTALAQIENSFA